MEVYSAEIEQKMRRFSGWLSEKDRRRYAAIEAAKLGHGGVDYIARVLACDPKTIRRWVERSLSLRQTCRQLGQSIFDVLVDAVTSSFQGRQPGLSWLY